MNHWMFLCQEVSQKVSRGMDAKLPWRHRLAIRIHLMMCRYCARFRRQLALLRRLSRSQEPDPSPEAPPESLSAEAKARMKEKLRSVS